MSNQSEIQQDAKAEGIYEGMMKASEIAQSRRPMDKYPRTSISAMNDRTISIVRAIETAALKLKPKD